MELERREQLSSFNLEELEYALHDVKTG